MLTGRGAFKSDLQCLCEAPDSPVKKAKQQRPRHPKPAMGVCSVTLLNAPQWKQPFGLRPLMRSAAEAGRTSTCVFSSDNHLLALPARKLICAGQSAAPRGDAPCAGSGREAGRGPAGEGRCVLLFRRRAATPRFRLFVLGFLPSFVQVRLWLWGKTRRA